MNTEERDIVNHLFATRDALRAASLKAGDLSDATDNASGHEAIVEDLALHSYNLTSDILEFVQDVSVVGASDAEVEKILWLHVRLTSRSIRPQVDNAGFNGRKVYWGSLFICNLPAYGTGHGRTRYEDTTVLTFGDIFKVLDRAWAERTA